MLVSLNLRLSVSKLYPCRCTLLLFGHHTHSCSPEVMAYYRDYKEELFNDDIDIDALMREFRNNGNDCEYSPETEERFKQEMRRVNISNNCNGLVEVQWQTLIQSISSTVLRMKYQSLPRDMVCTFCRNNGETISFYKSHSIKDQYDRISCPVLRKYVCPICKATGDNAHTRKYCPYNDEPDNVPLITKLKALRNSMGIRNGKPSQH